MEEKKEKKFLERLTIPAILPFSSPPPLFLKILYVLCYVISYNITLSTIFRVKILDTNVMLLIFVCSSNYLIINTLHLYFSVCYFIPSQLSLRIFMQFLLYIYPYLHFKHFFTLFLKFINILKHI